jgi:hypothetical protein
MEDQPQEELTLRERLTAEREDDPSYLTPSKPSELRGLSDEELSRLARKLKFANHWPFYAMIEHELTGRLIVSLKAFKQASDRSARVLIVLTAVLVVLTLVLVWLTIRLD